MKSVRLPQVSRCTQPHWGANLLCKAPPTCNTLRIFLRVSRHHVIWSSPTSQGQSYKEAAVPPGLMVQVLMAPKSHQGQSWRWMRS